MPYHCTYPISLYLPCLVCTSRYCCTATFIFTRSGTLGRGHQPKRTLHVFVVICLRAYLFTLASSTQCYAERQAAGVVPQEILDTGVNPAVFEIAGHMVLKRKEDYEAISQDLAWRMLEQVSLPEERFLQVAQICFG